MAEMKIGYGSEYQLLRYLGHHRNYLNKEIRKIIGEGEIQWMDYPVDIKRDSRDGELKGIECFENHSNFNNIKDEWEKYWPKGGNSQNWDGIFIHKGVWFFVEAKAHLEEANQKCGATSQESIDTIKDAFKETCGESEKTQRWLDSNCYQLANRLAFVHFCEKVGIEARLLYISFINGYETDPRKNVTDIKTWEDKWKEEYDALKLSETLKSKVYHLYIDCHNEYNVVKMSQT